MDGKIALLLVSMISIGMFVLPSTLALYTGSHAFVSGDNVNCGKCHTSGMDDIAAEVAGGTAHSIKSCKDCHGSNNPYDDIDLEGGDANGHAASMDVNCIGCHNAVDETVLDANVTNELNLTSAAHHELTFNITAPDDGGGIGDKDLVCIACHTGVPVNITDASLSTDSDTIWISGEGTTLWDEANWTAQ